MIKTISIFAFIFILASCNSKGNIIETPKDNEIKQTVEEINSNYEPIIINSYMFKENEEYEKNIPNVNAYVFEIKKDTIVVYDTNIREVDIDFKKIKPWITLEKQKLFPKCIVNCSSEDVEKLQSYKFIYASTTFALED